MRGMTSSGPRGIILPDAPQPVAPCVLGGTHKLIQELKAPSHM